LENIVVAVLEAIPPVLLSVVILVIIGLFYRPIRDQLIPKISGLKVMGVEISFIRDSINAAVELAEKSPQWKVEVPDKDRERAVGRAIGHLHILRGSHVLWVDDNPQNNRNERKMFRQLGVLIDIATTTREALGKLDLDEYDLVISDMARCNTATAGLEFLNGFRQKDGVTPVIFYIGVLDSQKGVPAGAMGITNRPDELLHLTLDALERRRD